MRAIVQDRYGAPDEVLHPAEIERPPVADDEVLVRVRAASVHPDVWHVVRGLPYVLRVMGAGVRRPKNPVPGTDAAGHVAAVGAGVTRFRPGDEVFGETTRGHQWANGGAFAEYVPVAEASLAPKPANITFEQAAAVPTSGIIALQGVHHQARVRSGQRVLINGAGGGVGLLAVQLAKAYGARVTGVDHPTKLDAVRSAGADDVVDYTREDFTRGSERYDVIVDIPGNHSLSACRRALTAEGTYVLIGHDLYGAGGLGVMGTLPRMLKLMAMTPFVRQLPRLDVSMPDKGVSMSVLNDFIESGRITPVVDRTFPLSETVDAIRHLEQGRATGKIVITV